MFYAYTQNTPTSEGRPSSRQIREPLFPKLTDAIVQRIGTNWLVVSPTTGGWCFLNEQEYEIYRQLVKGNPNSSICNRSLVGEWGCFVNHLVTCGLISTRENHNTRAPSSRETADLFSLTLILSGRCNLACRYCYLGVIANQQGPQLPSLIARQAISDAFQRATGSILIDFGEIAVSYRLFKELVSYVEQLHNQYPDKKLLLAIQTNGTMLNAEVLDFLEKHRITVGVSLDGPKHLNDKVRISNSGVGSHERIENGLREIIRREMDHIVLCTISKANIEHGAEILDYFLNLGVAHFSFKPVIRRGSAVDVWDSFGIDEEQYCEFLDSVVDYAISNCTWDALDHRLIKFAFRFLGDPRGWSDRCPTAECGCGTQMLVLNPAGSYYPCPRYASVSGADYLLGHDLSQAITTATQFTNSKLKQLPDKCDNCAWGSFCKGGCVLARQVANSTEQRPDPFCKIYQHMYKLILTRILPELASENKNSSSKLGKVAIVNQEFFTANGR